MTPSLNNLQTLVNSSLAARAPMSADAAGNKPAPRQTQARSNLSALQTALNSRMKSRTGGRSR